MNLILRTTGDPRSFTGAVRIQIAKLDKNLPVTAVQTIDELLAQASTQPRMIMILLTGFAGFALVLAIVGLYGAISYSVVQRTQEIGVRIALGATRGDLLRLVLGYGAAVTCVGIAIGIACSLLVTGAMEKLVYGISTQDPITFCVVAALFFVFGLLASYVPARRAMRVDVVEALRG
jgi:putative ABC transport system permease protein